MENNKIHWGKVAPVLLSFIVMGFVDIIGVATGYVKQDFDLTNFAVQFLPMMVLLWFFILSIPAGVLQDKYGKRKMLNIGILIQAIGLGLPFVSYSFGMMFVSFILLGIGNTVIQVSANPLLQDVLPADKLPSYLSASQFVKAIVSFSGPLIATFMASFFGEWRFVFVVYGVTSILAATWLASTPIQESRITRRPASFASCFRLLNNRFVALMSLSIFLIVGAEVAMNTNITNILTTKFGIPIEKAAIGISLFFAGETIARLVGAIILNWIKPRLFLLLITLVSLLGIVGVLFASFDIMAFTFIFITGLGAGNMFPIIFSLSLKKMPDRANEISGLLIMAVSGGAFIPLLTGFVSTTLGPVSSVLVIGSCLVYILWVSFYIKSEAG